MLNACLVIPTNYSIKNNNNLNNDFLIENLSKFLEVHHKISPEFF